MAVTFKMKLTLVWICLFSEVLLLPTQFPDDVNNNPKLIYKGHTSTRGLNVYVFELLPESKEAKDKRVQDDRSAIKRTEDYEDRIIPTNKPASIKAPDTETSTKSNTHKPNLKLDTMDSAIKHTENTEDYEDTIIPTKKPASMKAPNSESSTRIDTHKPNQRLDTNDAISAAQNDIEMYGDTSFVPNTTEGLKGTENREDHEDTIIPTNKPANTYGKKTVPTSGTSTRDNTHRPNVKFDANSSISATQKDIGIYENTDFLSNPTKGVQTEMSHIRDVQTNEYNTGPDYYGTEGSALFATSGYNDTDTDNQGPQVDFPANVNDLGCSEFEGQCKNLPNISVTKPTPHKDYSKSTTKDKPDRYTNKERNSKKKSMQPKKANKHKHEKQTHRTIHTKDIPKRYNTGKTIQYSRGQRRNIGGNRQNSKYYRSSSSESRSDSSQEFD